MWHAACALPALTLKLGPDGSRPTCDSIACKVVLHGKALVLVQSDSLMPRHPSTSAPALASREDKQGKTSKGRTNTGGVCTCSAAMVAVSMVREKGEHTMSSGAGGRAASSALSCCLQSCFKGCNEER